MPALYQWQTFRQTLLYQQTFHDKVSCSQLFDKFALSLIFRITSWFWNAKLYWCIALKYSFLWLCQISYAPVIVLNFYGWEIKAAFLIFIFTRPCPSWAKSERKFCLTKKVLPITLVCAVLTWKLPFFFVILNPGWFRDKCDSFHMS